MVATIYRVLALLFFTLFLSFLFSPKILDLSCRVPLYEFTTPEVRLLSNDVELVSCVSYSGTNLSSTTVFSVIQIKFKVARIEQSCSIHMNRLVSIKLMTRKLIKNFCKKTIATKTRATRLLHIYVCVCMCVYIYVCVCVFVCVYA